MNAAYFSKVKRDQAMRAGQDGSHPFRVSADRRERSSGRELNLLVSSKARLLSNLVGKNKQTNQQVGLEDLQNDCSLPRCE